ncbi:MAG: hypothetical protein K0U93_16100 [Gammaproteobacteria bacterium]|nr:hypothetical protein [Gammaproteobacteria bacterium]
MNREWRWRYRESVALRERGLAGHTVDSSGGRHHPDMYWDPAIGLGWRWRLRSLVERTNLTVLDVAWAIDFGSKPRVVRRRDDGEIELPKALSTTKNFIYSGVGQFDAKRVSALMAFMTAQMGLDDIAPLTGYCATLEEFESRLPNLRPASAIASRVDLELLPDAQHLRGDDAERAELREDFMGFLDPDRLITKPVFLFYSEFSLRLQMFVRESVTRACASHAWTRALAVDASDTDAAGLVRAIAQTDVETKEPLEALAERAVSSLNAEPAILVILNFEPVLAGFDVAAVHGAIRNTGFHDMFLRILRRVSSGTRVVALSNRLLQRVEATYLYDVRHFQGLRAPFSVGPVIAEIQDRARELGISPRILRNARDMPGDTLAYILQAANLSDERRINSIIESQALDDTVEQCFFDRSLAGTTDANQAWVPAIVAVSALVEDRIKLATLFEVLGQVTQCPLANAELPPIGSWDAFCVTVRQVCRDFEHLVVPVQVSEPDLVQGAQPALDLAPLFRESVIRLFERDGTPLARLRWARRVRRQVAAISRRDDQMIQAGIQRVDLEDEPAAYRRTILSIVLLLGSIDPTELEATPAAHYAQPDLPLPDPYHPRASASVVLAACHQYIRELEGPQFRLSASHAGCQLKLHLWLCFQHIGFARPPGASSSLRDDLPAGPAPAPLALFSVRENVQMFISLALGALRSHELAICANVLSAADAFVRSQPLNSTDVVLRSKLWKIQVDLHLRRGELAEAERCVRDCLRQVGFFDRTEPAAFVSGKASALAQAHIEALPTEPEGRDATGASVRLLGRLGEVLRLRGREVEAGNCFELALRLDQHFADADARTHLGQSARGYIHLLCEQARARRLTKQGLERLDSAEKIQRLLTSPAGSSFDRIWSAIDDATLAFTHVTLSLTHRDAVDALLRCYKNCVENEHTIRARRLHGVEVAQLVCTRVVLASRVLLDLEEQHLSQLRAAGAQFQLKELFQLMAADTDRVIGLIQTHEWRRLSPTSSRGSDICDDAVTMSAAPLVLLDAFVGRITQKLLENALQHPGGKPQGGRARHLGREISELRRQIHKLGYFKIAPIVARLESLAPA